MTGEETLEPVVALLMEARVREKGQALFYRHLAAEAERLERPDETERLNELHADEQHHLSRLTARLLEVGGAPEELRHVEPLRVPIDDWETVARQREQEEVHWYQDRLGREIDGRTRALLEEILESERNHRDRLGGKWMSA